MYNTLYLKYDYTETQQTNKTIVYLKQNIQNHLKKLNKCYIVILL